MTEELDPIGFVAAELSARGALVDVHDRDGATAMVPATLARAFMMAEFATLSASPGAEVTFAGLGSPLLDLLVAEVRRTPAIAALRWTAEPPRTAAAEAAAARVTVRNAVADVVGVTTTAALYALPFIAWTAEADDRFQGVVAVAAHGLTLAAPESVVVAALDGDALEASDPAEVSEAACAMLAQRANHEVARALAPIRATVARRQEREAGRQREYFRQLGAEARRPRRQITASAIASRVAAIEAEAEAKRDELSARYRLRVTTAPAALVLLTARVAEISLRIRRRKGERVLALHLPPGARHVDALACASCADTTRAPLVCDDALHVLCEACAPVATGRPTCAACAPRPRR